MRQRKWFGRMLAVALSAAMAIPAMPFSAAPAQASETETTVLYYGDVDMDGTVSAEDALSVLKHVVKLTEITDETSVILADMTKDGALGADDALEILKTVVKINPLIKYEGTATPSEAPSEKPSEAPSEEPTPTPTPIPTLPAVTQVPVIPDPANVVEGEPLVVIRQNGAHYTSEEDIYTFYQGEEYVTGMQVRNPFAGEYDLAEDPRVLIEESTPEPGKDLVWDLAGASYDPQDVYPSGADLRVAMRYGPELDMVNPETGIPWYEYINPLTGLPCDKGVTYTRPEYKEGVSISFWAKSKDEDGNDTAPALLFANDSFMLTVRLNGSAYFKHAVDSTNFLKLGNTEASAYDVWQHYTVTIKNDWITVYVNGQEALYNNLDDLSRKVSGKFNDGFLSRYNPIGDLTWTDIENDWRRYYVEMGAWYFNNEDLEVPMWVSHDNFSTFGNARFRGAGGGGELIMDLLTADDTKLYIGGMVTAAAGNETRHNMANGTQVSQLTYFMSELTPEQVAANYDAATKPADIAIPDPTPEPTPTPTPTPTPDPNKTEDPDRTPAPSYDPAKVVDGVEVTVASADDVASNGKGTFSQSGNVITFNERQASGTIRNPKYWGAVYNNPMVGNTNVKQTVDEALAGQTLFPADERIDEYTLKMVACDDISIQSWRGNFYDYYLGDLYTYGNFQNPAPNPEDSSQTKTYYDRPVWTKGASYSFWFKPTADMTLDEAILTMTMSGNYMFYMDAKGTVFFVSLQATDAAGDQKDWYKGQDMTASNNARPYNSFVATGDASKVKVGEWNYYTVTFANDMITVYINGEELIYSKLGLNRGDQKFFNGGYLTRYNTIGLCFAETDPVRQYLTKSGYIQDAPRTSQEEFEELGDISDNLSIRANGVYERYLLPNGKVHAGSNTTGTLLIDFLTMIGTNRLIIGGGDTPLQDANSLEPVFDKEGNPVLDEFGNQTYSGWRLNTFNDVKFSTEHKLPAGAKAADVRFYESELTAEQVLNNYYKACHTMPY